MSTKQKKADRLSDADIDEFLHTVKTRTLSAEQVITNIAVAAVVALLPAYVYFAAFDLAASGATIIALIVVAGAVVALSTAYRNVESQTYTQLEHARKFTGVTNYKKLKLSKEAADNVQDQVTAQESLVWSLFVNNAIYLGLFMFFGFYMFKAVDVAYNFTIANVLASAITWQLSNASNAK